MSQYSLVPYQDPAKGYSFIAPEKGSIGSNLQNHVPLKKCFQYAFACWGKLDMH